VADVDMTVVVHGAASWKLLTVVWRAARPWAGERVLQAIHRRKTPRATSPRAWESWRLAASGTRRRSEVGDLPVGGESPVLTIHYLSSLHAFPGSWKGYDSA
jgi:hypothetical protein